MYVAFPSTLITHEYSPNEEEEEDQGNVGTAIDARNRNLCYTYSRRRIPLSVLSPPLVVIILCAQLHVCTYDPMPSGVRYCGFCFIVLYSAARRGVDMVLFLPVGGGDSGVGRGGGGVFGDGRRSGGRGGSGRGGGTVVMAPNIMYFSLACSLSTSMSPGEWRRHSLMVVVAVIVVVLVAL